MFKGFGRGWFAVGLILGLYAFLPFAYWQAGYLTERPVKHQYEQTSGLQSHKQTPNRVDESIKPQAVEEATHPKQIGHPQYYEHHDLNAQKSMAKSTETIVLWTKISMALAAVGAILIWLTLVETRKTTKAAVKATDEATATNEIARKQYQAGFKPWLEVQAVGPFFPKVAERESLSARIPMNDATCACLIRVKNLAKMPATLEHFEVYLGHGDEWPYVRPTPIDRQSPRDGIFEVLNDGDSVFLDQRKGVVDQTESHWKNDLEVVDLQRSQINSFISSPPPVIGRLVCSDPLGNRWENHFAFQAVLPNDNGFKRYGGRKMNYEKMLYENQT